MPQERRREPPVHGRISPSQERRREPPRAPLHRCKHISQHSRVVFSAKIFTYTDGEIRPCTKKQGIKCLKNEKQEAQTHWFNCLHERKGKPEEKRKQKEKWTKENIREPTNKKSERKNQPRTFSHSCSSFLVWGNRPRPTSVLSFFLRRGCTSLSVWLWFFQGHKYVEI